MAIVANGGHLRKVEEDIDVAQHDNVSVDENDLVVVGELP